MKEEDKFDLFEKFLHKTITAEGQEKLESEMEKNPHLREELKILEELKAVMSLEVRDFREWIYKEIEQKKILPKK